MTATAASSRIAEFWDQAIVRRSSSTSAFQRSRRSSTRSGARTATSTRRSGWRNAGAGATRSPHEARGAEVAGPHAFIASGDSRYAAGSRDHHCLRPSRQAAGDDRLACGPGAVDAVIEDGKLYGAVVRTTATRCSARFPPARPAGAKAAARTLLRADRELRGERQLRPAGVSRCARAAHRHAGAGHRPRLRLRQLRAALGHDLAARPGERGAHRRGADRGRALRRRERRGGFELPPCAPAARAHRGGGHRRHQAGPFHAPIPPQRSEQPGKRPRCWARRSGASFRSCPA